MDSAQLATIPAEKDPPGVIPNHINPYSSGPTLIAVGSLLVALMFIFTTIRAYTKSGIVKEFTPDDCEYKSPHHT